MPLNLFYTMVQKSQKWPKTQIKGGGSCLKTPTMVSIETKVLSGYSFFGQAIRKTLLEWILRRVTGFLPGSGGGGTLGFLEHKRKAWRGWDRNARIGNGCQVWQQMVCYSKDFMAHIWPPQWPNAEISIYNDTNANWMENEATVPNHRSLATEFWLVHTQRVNVFSLIVNLLLCQAVGLGAPQTSIRCVCVRERERECVCVCVCHRGHCKALTRCRLVGSCVRPGENVFP